LKNAGLSLLSSPDLTWGARKYFGEEDEKMKKKEEEELALFLRPGVSL